LYFYNVILTHKQNITGSLEFYLKQSNSQTPATLKRGIRILKAQDSKRAAYFLSGSFYLLRLAKYILSTAVSVLLKLITI